MDGVVIGSVGVLASGLVDDALGVARTTTRGVVVVGCIIVCSLRGVRAAMLPMPLLLVRLVPGLSPFRTSPSTKQTEVVESC